MASRILLLTDVFPPRRGGSGRWLWELYRRLEGIDVTVAAGQAEGTGQFDRTAPFPIRRLPLSFRNWGISTPGRLWTYLKSARSVSEIASAAGADALHCGKCLPEGLVAWFATLRSRLPYWCYAHGEELSLALTSRELGWLSRRVFARADRVIANSRHTRRLLLDQFGVADERVVVLTPGVDASFFVPAAPDPDVRRQFGWTGRRVILTVGALQKRKGQDMLIRALPAIRRRCRDVLYAMAGEGWERPYLEQLASELDVDGSVQFLGTPDDETLVRCYQQCDLFVLPNRQVGWNFEGFGIALLEAQACGRPVIAGVSGGAPETLEPGRTGEVVSCETPDALVEACIRLLEDPGRRQQLGVRGRSWVLERFDWPVLVRQATAMFGVPLAGE